MWWGKPPPMHRCHDAQPGESDLLPPFNAGSLTQVGISRLSRPVLSVSRHGAPRKNAASFLASPPCRASTPRSHARARAQRSRTSRKGKSYAFVTHDELEPNAAAGLGPARLKSFAFFSSSPSPHLLFSLSSSSPSPHLLFSLSSSPFPHPPPASPAGTIPALVQSPST